MLSCYSDQHWTCGCSSRPTMGSWAVLTCKQQPHVPQAERRPARAAPSPRALQHSYSQNRQGREMRQDAQWDPPQNNRRDRILTLANPPSSVTLHMTEWRPEEERILSECWLQATGCESTVPRSNELALILRQVEWKKRNTYPMELSFPLLYGHMNKVRAYATKKYLQRKQELMRTHGRVCTYRNKFLLQEAFLYPKTYIQKTCL